jgi:signal transduction histidine kinase
MFALAIGLLGVTMLTLAGIQVVLFADAPLGPQWALFLYTGVGVLYALTGLLAWRRRPSNAFGAILLAGSLALLLSAFQDVDIPALVAVGLVTAVVPIAVILHVLLAFPGGRLSRQALWLVLAGYAITGVLQAPRYLLSNLPEPGGVLQVAHSASLITIDSHIQDGAGIIVIVLTALLLAQRLRATDGVRRRRLGLLYGYGIFAILFLEISANLLPALFSIGPVAVFVLQIATLAGVPVAFGLGVLRGGFAPTAELEELGAWLGGEDSIRPGLRDALAAALGDDSVELLFWSRDAERFVDAAGGLAALPAAGSGRGVVEVAMAGERVGAINYDARLIVDPGLVRAAGRVVALAVERERLTAELLTSREALRESRARIVAAGDQERRRIARDLHDGLQVQLVLLGIRAGQLAGAATMPSDLIAQATQVRVGLDAAAAELRSLVEGLMPALLIERGLSAATEELVDRLPLPARLELDADGATLTAAAETAGYFVVAEALTNAVKHSQARQLSVSLCHTVDTLRIEVRDDGIGGARPDGGSGLRGLADRLDVLGGRLDVVSVAGMGTRIVAELPCGS